MEKQSDYNSLSSSATHRIIQPSTTLNRKYVKRPVVQRVHRESATQERHTPAAQVGMDTKKDAPVLSSRLVNLHIHRAKPEPRKINLEDIPRPQATFSPAAEPEDTNIPNTVSGTTLPPQEIKISNVSPHLTKSAQSFVNIPQAEPEIVTQPPSPFINKFNTPSYNYSESIPSAPVMVSNTVSSNNSKPEITTSTGLVSPFLSQNNNTTQPEPQSNYLTPEPIEKVLPKNADPASKESIEAIAKAAAAAIASIHNATAPEEVYAEMDKLRHTTEQIQNQEPSGLAKISQIKEPAKTETPSISINTRKSTKKSSNSTTIKTTNADDNPTASINNSNHRVIKNSVPKLKTRTNITPSPAELKDKAIRNALRSMADTDEELEIEVLPTKTKTNSKPKTTKTKEKPAPVPHNRPVVKHKHSGKRFILAFACAAACVAMIVSFVSNNIPDISVKVAALQTGIQASYPSYIPREFNLQGITSENGKIMINFGGPDNATFTLIEEKSSWDSSALVRNYVEPNWGEDYVTTHEQGITIYMSGSNAAWVNGGVMYKITASLNALTAKQLRNIVTSL